MPDQGIQTPTRSVFQNLFPIDTGTWMSRILGTQKRSVDRMMDGYSTTAPRILEKVSKQADNRDELIAEIEAALTKAEQKGTHVLVIRYALADILKGSRLDRDDDPI
jgi:hypothetical protein